MALIEQKAQVYVNKAKSHTIIKAPYNRQLIEAIKAVGDAKWYAEGHCWVLPASSIEAAKQAVRPYYRIEGEESYVTWKIVRMRVKFKQHKTARVRKYGKAVLIDSTDLINVDYGNTYKCSPDFDILEEQGGFTQGDEHAAYWTVEYIMTVKMRENARIEAIAGTYEILEQEVSNGN